MHHYFEAITNTSGDSLVGYFARVIDPATQNTVTMSADDNGTPIVTKSGVENMGSTDDYGNLDFYVVPGTYHLDIYAPNATSFIFRVPSVAMNSTKGDPGPQGDEGPQGEGLEEVMAPDGSALVGLKIPVTGSVTRTVRDKAAEYASVLDFGAKGDGVTDDSAAFQAAVNATQYLFVPPGRYKFGSTVNLDNGQTIFGAGKSAWEPYTGGAFPAVTRSEILVNGILALNAANTNSVTLSGLSIKATGGSQSAYATPAGFQAGSAGINIAGSLQFEARDISLMGLAKGVYAEVAGSPAQMPRISDWMASDCDVVFSFGSPASTDYTARDVKISDNVIALHCNRMVEAHWSDGVRLENLRLFQSYNKSIYMRECPYIDIVGSTIFEGAQDAVTLVDCKYVNINAKIARTGAYQTTTPYTQRVALTLTNCEDVYFGGMIQQVSGAALNVTNCKNVCFDSAVGTPFWTSGNLSNASGAINVATSSSVVFNTSIAGAGHWVNVFSDSDSEANISGTVIGDPLTANVRATRLMQTYAHTTQIVTAMDPIAAGGTSPTVGTIRVPVPAGKSLVTRCVQVEGAAATLRVGAQFWNAAYSAGEVDGGAIALDNKTLLTNSTGATIWSAIDFTLYNPGAGTVTVPTGAKVKIALALT